MKQINNSRKKIMKGKREERKEKGKQKKEGETDRKN